MKKYFLYSYSNICTIYNWYYYITTNILGQGFFFYKERQKREVRIRIVYVFENLGKRFFFLNQQTDVVLEKKSDMTVAKYGTEVGT